MGHDPAPARDGVGILCDKSSRKIRQPKRLEIAVNANVQNLHDTISSEAPADHWGDVNCSGVTVLDLGAGDFGMRHDRTYMSTVDHWLELGASSVVAVDMNLRDLVEVGGDDRVTIVADTMFHSAQIDALLEQHRPAIVKVDIEGAECLLRDVRRQSFRIAEAWLIETHTDALHDDVMVALDDHGFDVVRVRGHVDSDRFRVIYASRRSDG